MVEGGSMEESEIAQVLSYDFSVGTEEFREQLLGRCLSVLDFGDQVMPLSDEYLQHLAAAGDLLPKNEDDQVN